MNSSASSSTALDAEIAILGAGCAGLSLAVALLEAGEKRRILLVEHRTQYSRDRSWCMWATERHPFVSCVSHRWWSWSVSWAGTTIRSFSQRFPYEHIPADRFYDFARERIARAPNCKLLTGVNVLSLRSQQALVEIESNLGTLRCRQAFDSRNTGEELTAQPVLWQQFLGWHLRTSRPIFDPTTVNLMEFHDRESVASRGMHFFYVLPFAADEALVETTYFDSLLSVPADFERDLKAWIEDRIGGGSYEVVYREHGSLPMSVRPPAPASPGVKKIGIAGGRLKPSTGYGFLRIQRQSAVLARALVREPSCRLTPQADRNCEPIRYAWLDRVLLEVLSRNADQGPAYFAKLFSAVPPEDLVRFLSESGTMFGDLRVLSSLPWKPFAVAALRSFISDQSGALGSYERTES